MTVFIGKMLITPVILNLVVHYFTNGYIILEKKGILLNFGNLLFIIKKKNLNLYR